MKYMNILCYLLIFIGTILGNIIQNIIMKMKNRKLVCSHKWSIIETSNILQLDDMGYPLMLCICECKLCEKKDQVWIDVNKEILDNNEYKILKWNNENFIVKHNELPIIFK